MPQRLLIPSTALLWGLQFAFLNPALALLLTTLYSASTTEVGWALALYNASALIATTIIPARADRTGQYLRPMIVSAVLTVVLAAVLALVTSLPLAMAALVVLGGPAGVGSTLLFAHLRHAGATSGPIINTRASFSVRSEEHTPELQSRGGLVRRLLLAEKECRPVRWPTGTPYPAL